MSFLAPIWLALAAAIAVPLMLHLMRRRIETLVDFPAVRYLARAERENVRKVKLRNLLLMLLRTLAVLLLALAAARPVGALLGAGHVPTAVAIVVDNSLSSGAIVEGAPELTRLKEAARGVIDESGSSDRLWLVSVDGVVTGGPKAALHEALDRLDVFGGRGDLASALTRAAGLVLASGLEARQVLLLTDGQASAWTRSVTLGDVRAVVYASAGTAAPNRSLALAEARPPRWTPRGAIVVRAAGADSATYRVTLGDRTLARGLLREGDEAIVRVEPAERGWVAGRVDLAPDELRADDERHFAAWIGEAPAVRVHPAAGPFAQRAVEALEQSQRARRGTAIEVAPADAATQLPALLLAPSDPVRAGAANRTLERLGVPWRFGEMRRDETVARGASFDGTPIRLRYALRAVPGPASDTLASASGEPWIVAGEGFVLLGSPLDVSATGLPVRAPFLPWLADALAQRLGGAGSAIIMATPGQRVRVPAGVSAIEAPDGTTAPPPGDGVAPSRAGVYFLRRGDQRAGALVVNPEPEESRLERLDLSALASRVESADRVATADAGRLRATAFEAGARRPLQATFLLLALACLLAEMVIVRRAERTGAARAA